MLKGGWFRTGEDVRRNGCVVKHIIWRLPITEYRITYKHTPGALFTVAHIPKDCLSQIRLSLIEPIYSKEQND